MKIKVGNFNFINKKENRLGSYDDIQNGMNYFYIDGKEKTLFVNDKTYIDKAKTNQYSEYDFEREISEKYDIIIDYNIEIMNQINVYLREKIIDKFIKNDYSRYNLYNKINFNDILKVNENSNFSFYYGEEKIIDFDKNRIYRGEFVFNPYTEKIENLDQMYEKGRFKDIIKAGLIKLEIENNKAPDFIYSILKINEFFKDKQTVNLQFEGYEKFKVNAELNSIFRLYNNQMNLDFYYYTEKPFKEANPDKNIKNLKLEELKGITYGKNVLDIDGISLCHLKEQISINPEDKLHFRIDELNEELNEKYNTYSSENISLGMPYRLSDAFLTITKIDAEKFTSSEEYPEWYSDEVKQILDDYVSLRNLEKIQTLDDLKEIIKKYDDKELQSIYYSLKNEERKLEDTEQEELDEENM